MIEITVKKNFDVGKMIRAIPNETAILLNDIADAAIMDMRKGVKEHIDLNNVRFKKLARSTVESKRKAGYHPPDRPLHASGKMVGVGARGTRRGIYVKIRATAKKLLSVITTAAATPYAVYHQEGTPPYKIRPVRASVLAFIGSEGQTVFAKEVDHPGLKQREWFGVSKRMPRKVDKLIKAAEGRVVRSGDTGGMK